VNADPLPMRELFVYYRVPAMHVAAARLAVRTLHADLSKRHAGLQVRLLRRDCEDAGTQTWMETCAWPGSPGGVTPSLQAEIEFAAAALLPLIDGPRHCEVFEPV
jgi:hypothetical protein